jgi:hypothetical protein
MIIDLSDTELAYIAGIIDGEGCIGGYLSNTGFVIQLLIANTNKELMDWLSDKLAYNLYTTKAEKHKRSWRIAVSGSKAIAILSRVRPYMVAKAAAADVALSFPLNPGKNRITEEARLKQAICCAQLQNLNRKGDES